MESKAAEFWEWISGGTDPARATDVVRGEVGVVGPHTALALWLAGALWNSAKDRPAVGYRQ